jgi:hypothetical protein
MRLQEAPCPANGLSFKPVDACYAFLRSIIHATNSLSSQTTHAPTAFVFTLPLFISISLTWCKPQPLFDVIGFFCRWPRRVLAVRLFLACFPWLAIRLGGVVDCGTGVAVAAMLCFPDPRTVGEHQFFLGENRRRQGEKVEDSRVCLVGGLFRWNTNASDPSPCL